MARVSLVFYLLGPLPALGLVQTYMWKEETSQGGDTRTSARGFMGPPGPRQGELFYQERKQKLQNEVTL